MSSRLLNYDRNILIDTIDLVNFMCHDHLVVDFKKKFTCIGGRNGSGKSAIMISLGILFGLRSSNLDRGNSLKNLIKTGESFFIVKCVLNNTKKFMYETFGDWIILEKKVTIKSNTFSVLNKDKKTIFNRVEDLEYLMDYYDLKFDNPLNFLTQEMAKRFLSSSDPKVLYQLFLKATEIADIRIINEEYKNNVNIMREKIEIVKKELEGINQKIDSETKRVESFSNIQKLEKKIELCKMEIEWSKVEKIKSAAKTLEVELITLNNTAKEKQDTLTAIMEESEKIKQEKKELATENKNLQEKNKARLDEIESEISTKEVKIRSIEQDLEELEKDNNYKQDLIKKFELSNTFVDKRDELFEQKKKIDSKEAVITERLENLRYTIENKEEKRNQEIENQKAYEKRLWKVRKQLEYLSRSTEQSKLHPKIDDVIKEVESRKFKDVVLGPIGKYIKIKDQKWAKVVSIVTHKILTNFICFNPQDRETLHLIFKKHNVPFSVQMPSTRMDRLIDYRGNSDYTSILDVISVSSTIVLNQLIIMLSLERLVLISNREKAYSVMRGSPRNVEGVYLPNGDIIKKVGGSLSDFSSKRLDRYYFESATDKKNELQNELKTLIENKPQTVFSQEYKKLKEEADSLALERDELLKMSSKINREIETAENMFATQKELMSNENLYEEKKSIENQIKVLEKKTEKMKNEILMLEREKQEIKNTIYRSVADLDKQLMEKQAKFYRINLEMNNLVIKKLEVEKNYKIMNSDYENKRDLLLEKSELFESPREEAAILGLIERFKTEIEEINKIATVEESEAILDELEIQKNIKEDFLATYQAKTEELSQSFQDRVEKREALKESISQGASIKFKEITSERGYLGELVFDHKNESLLLKMKVHNLEMAGSKETLSGGERSFAAMSLLLSLWPYVSCPVKILDEFDVFMDNLNRKFIIEKFKQHFVNGDNQVILITPLNTNDLEDDEIDIISLKSPERKET